MNIYPTTKDYFDYYKSKYGNIMVAYDVGGRWRYFTYMSKEYNDFKSDWFLKGMEQEANHRYIFPDEVVIDLDGDKKSNKKYLKLIKKYLEENKITYSLWETGGRGYHFHLFYEELIDYPVFKRSIIKEKIVKKITYGYYKDARIDNQLFGKHLIRAEYGIHRDTLKNKTLMDYRDFGNNVIPKDILDKLEKYTEKKEKKFIELADDKEPACIRFFKQEDFMNINDGRKRALFILASWYSNKLPKDDVKFLLERWNRYQLNNYLKPIQIKSTLRSNKGYVGCRYRKALLREFGMSKLCEGCQFNRAEYYKGKKGDKK